MNKTTIYCRRYRLILTDELELFDDRNIWSKKDNLLKIGKLLGVEDKTGDEIPNNGWNMANMETDGRKLLQYKQIFKAFSEQITYLICPEHPTLNQRYYVWGTKVYQSLKENFNKYCLFGKERNTGHSCNHYCHIIWTQTWPCIDQITV